MNALGNRTLARTIGFVAGCAIVLAVADSGRVQAVGGALPSSVSVATVRSSELLAAPEGRVLTAELRPGRGSRGQVRLTNPTDVTLGVRPRALPSARELDSVLLLGLSSRGRRVFSGPLGDLRSRSARAVSIPPGRTVEIDVEARLPASPPERYQGRAAMVKLEWRTQIAGRP